MFPGGSTRIARDGGGFVSIPNSPKLPIATPAPAPAPAPVPAPQTPVSPWSVHLDPQSQAILQGPGIFKIDIPGNPFVSGSHPIFDTRPACYFDPSSGANVVSDCQNPAIKQYFSDNLRLMVSDNPQYKVDFTKFGFNGPLIWTDTQPYHCDEGGCYYADNVSKELVDFLNSKNISIAITVVTKGYYYACLVFPSGNPIPETIFGIGPPDDSIFWAAAMLAVGFISGGGLGVAISPASTVGGIVLGSTTAAAYPLLATTIGNVALQTVINGGDVKAAVVSSLLASAGVLAGGAAKATTIDLTKVDALGKLSEVAAKTYVYGGDVKSAVAGEALKLGVSNMGSFLDWFSSGSSSAPIQLLANDLTPLVVPDLMPIPDITITPSPAPAISTIDQTIAPIGQPSIFQPVPIDNTVLQPLSTIPTINTVIPSASSNSSPTPSSENSSLPSFGTIVQNITGTALAALSLVNAYKQTQAPVSTVSRTVTNSGAVQSVQNDGLIHTQNPNGTQNVGMPAPGHPVSTTSGALVVNNGNGTYTLIQPNGSTQILQYPQSALNAPSYTNQPSGISAAIGSVPTVYLLGGAGLIAFLLMRRK